MIFLHVSLKYFVLINIDNLSDYIRLCKRFATYSKDVCKCQHCILYTYREIQILIVPYYYDRLFFLLLKYLLSPHFHACVNINWSREIKYIFFLYCMTYKLDHLLQRVYTNDEILMLGYL
jgi:hypothetical protein